jgi:hypothetical protein
MSDYNSLSIYVSKAGGSLCIKCTEQIDQRSLFYGFVPDLLAKSSDCIKGYEIKLIFHSLDELMKGQPLSNNDTAKFGQDILRQEKTRIPLIHIPLSNVFETHRNEHLPTYASRTYKIMDSSIWNYMIPFLSYNSSKGTYEWDKNVFIEKIKLVLTKICNNYEKGLYNLSVAHEYADINARLTEQAFLTGGGHSAGVSPFIFHSEEELEELIKKEFLKTNRLKKKTSIDQIKEHKWRILLVDDKAVEKMGTIEDSDNKIDSSHSIPKNSKLSIIMSLLEEQNLIDNEHLLYFPPPKEKNTNNVIDKRTNIIDEIAPNTHYLVEYVETVADAKKSLREKKYDLILLDYLLVADKDNRRYGYQLLEDIFNEVSLKHLLDDISNILLSPSKDEGDSLISESDFNSICDIISNSDSMNLLKNEPYHQIITEILGAQFQHSLARLLENLNKKTDLRTLWNYFITDNNNIPLRNKKYTALKLKTIREAIDHNGYKIGPRKRLFFIFISAYSSAVYERLLAEGLNQSEDYWHIAVGACPTNTPQLFLYNLIKLMEKRLEDSGILKLSSDEILRLTNIIFRPKEQDIRNASVRQRANAFFQEVLSLQYHYRNILRDVDIPFGNKNKIFDTKGSVLMTNFIIEKINLGGMLEHLTQLVNLTAFGTIRQWPEMWQEYTYFKAQFEKQIKIEGNYNQEKFVNLCKDIEEHILTLKSQQQ